MNKEIQYARYDQSQINNKLSYSCPAETEIKYIDQINQIATDLVESAARVQKDEKVLIHFDSNLAYLASQINKECQKKGTQVSFLMRDLENEFNILNQTDSEDKIKDLFAQEKSMVNDADNIIIIRGPKDPGIMSTLPKEKQKLYNDLYAEAHRRRVKTEMKWTAMMWPTEFEAKKENMSYEEYLKLFLEACAQPWEEIYAAQEKLIAKLDKAESLEFFAENTHVTMSIKDMTFCNSTNKRNYPGSEVFSAPVLNTVNGNIFAPGEYIYDGHVMSNIHILIKDGRIMENSYAEGNDQAFQSILNSGEGSRYFGEVALGTNPGLNKRLFNPLLNEKVWGSIHMAIGHCYEFTNYEGKPVNVKNGNGSDKTRVHWDLTVLMHQEGKVVLDGEIISQNGRFLDPDLAILNPKI